jgi:hypothetical protein
MVAPTIIIKKKGGKLHPQKILLLNRINACALSVLANALKSENTVDLCEQCVVRTLADIVAGVNMSSSLLYENVARENLLSVSALYSETL